MPNRVLMYPLPTHAAQDSTQSINNIVLALQKHLPAFGYELTENRAEADLIAGHAGTPDGKTIVDVAHLSGLYPTAYGTDDSWQWAINQRVIETCRHAKAVTVPSAWVGEILQRDMGFSPDVIAWGIDAAEWTPPAAHGNYVLWNKARADKVCDPKPLVDLAAICPQQLFLTTFLDKDKPNNQASATPNVKAVGRVPFEEMKGYVRNAALYLATTKETFGIGTIEAMAAGVPVVGYAYGGTNGIVQHGVTGYLVEPDDIEGLKRGVEYCIKNRATLSQNARKRALEYTWENCARAFSEVYDRVLAPQPGVKVSVIIPCYNYGKWVQEAMASVNDQQTDFDFELLVVDDGSTDDSAKKALLQMLGVDNENIVRKAALTKPNGGVASARNYGIERAQGRYIVCLDADDKLGDPRFLQTLADALDADNGLGIAYTGLRVMREDGEVSPNVSPFPPQWDFDAQLQRHNTVPTCCMFRKEAWRRAGGYRKEVQPAEDANLWLRIGSLGYRARKVTDEGWFIYRMHGNSLSTDVRTGKKPEPNWAAFPYVADGRHPFASQATPAYYSHPVRNYDKPVVSVIIPVGKGHEGILYRALDSVEYQTLREWEVIVVNDTGKELPLVGYAWVRTVATVRAGCGAATARNTGIAATRAPLVTFLDADDYFLPTFLERMVAAYRRSKGRYVYCDWISVNKDGIEEPHITPEFEPELMFKSKSVHSINVVMRKSDALKYPFDETMNTWEDVDFFMRLVANGVCGKRVNEPLIVYDYNTGKLRERGETVKESLIKLLYERYKPFIEGQQMCSCGSVTGSNGTLSAGELNAALASAGDMVLVEYQGAHGGHSVVGGATGQNYGYRQYGDVFNVWKADALNNSELFVPLMSVEKEVTETVEPPEPELA